jgi:hypothetical protein
MLITNTNGAQTPAHNINHLRIKQLPGGSYELHVWPPAGEPLDPHGCEHMEVPVAVEEIARILQVAPHLFGRNEPLARKIAADALAPTT